MHDVSVLGMIMHSNGVLCWPANYTLLTSMQLTPPLHVLVPFLQDCMQALCAACQAQGLPELGARLAALTQHPSSTQQTQQQPPPPASPTPGPQTAQPAPATTAGNACSPSPLSLLPALALQIARAFLPRHASWLLCKCVAVLAMPGARALHEPVLALLTALFRVPGLKLGPQATAMVAGSELFTPLVALAQVGGVVQLGAWLCRACHALGLRVPPGMMRMQSVWGMWHGACMHCCR